MTRCDSRDTASNGPDDLEAAFPRWAIWISDTGRWWASLRDQLTAAEHAKGRVPFLRADGPDALAKLLAEQEAKEGEAARER